VSWSANPATVGVLLVVALLLGIASVVLGIIAVSGQRRVARAYRTFSMGSRDDVLTLMERHLDEVRRLRGDALQAHRRIDELRELLRDTVSRVGTIRYDAFDDMGGHLSFSTALLNERGDGVVVTAINGRTDTRTYAKAVLGGGSRHNLSAEEVAAIEQAMAPRSRPPRPRPAARQRAGRPRPPAPARPVDHDAAAHDAAAHPQTTSS
jgi:hypothetical protein